MSHDLIAKLDDKLRAKRESFDRIPLIDIAPLLDGSDKRAVAKQIRWALSNTGFMYVKNHAIAPAVINSVFALTRLFFDRPMNEKMALHVSNSDVALRGYIEPFGENTDPGRTIDLKECFDIGPERKVLEGPFFGPNQWPAGFRAFREMVSHYHSKMVELAKSLLRGIALSLDLPEKYFEGLMLDPISIQRLLHYPSQSGVVGEGMIGTGAHTDYGNLTILAQDDVGGLQVMNRDGDWIEATPVPGTFVINIGDLIQRLTNDVYLANMHRVVNTSGKERYSIPFFIDADYNAVIEPLPSCVSETNPRRYPAVTCGEHKFGRFAASYTHLMKTAA